MLDLKLDTLNELSIGLDQNNNSDQTLKVIGKTLFLKPKSATPATRTRLRPRHVTNEELPKLIKEDKNRIQTIEGQIHEIKNKPDKLLELMSLYKELDFLITRNFKYNIMHLRHLNNQERLKNNPNPNLQENIRKILDFKIGEIEYKLKNKDDVRITIDLLHEKSYYSSLKKNLKTLMHHFEQSFTKLYQTCCRERSSIRHHLS